ncbi:MAG: biopolymer transporter ExbD [Planctomycetota bacterium]
MSDGPDVFDMNETSEDAFQMRKRPLDDSEMDITPMIDITFLLLIFFLVASKMEADAEIKLPAAKNGTAVTTKSSAFVTITEGKGEVVNVFLGNGTDDELRVNSSDLVEQESAIAEYIDKMLVEENKEQVVIKAGKEVKHREVARVMQAIGQVPDAKIFVAVLEES